MMKKMFTLTAFLLAGVLLLVGCAMVVSKTDVIYRGEISSIAEDGSILVERSSKSTMTES